jgi:hypothetical protein
MPEERGEQNCRLPPNLHQGIYWSDNLKLSLVSSLAPLFKYLPLKPNNLTRKDRD